MLEGTVVSLPPRVGRLDSVHRIRREMGKIYREVRAGTLNSQESTRLVYILLSLSRMLVDSDLETRIKRLEDGAGVPAATSGDLSPEILQRIREEVYGLGPAMKNGKN